MAAPSATMRVFRVNKSPNDTIALTNCIAVNPRDFPNPSDKYIILDELFVFTIRPVDGFPPGELGTSLFHRRFASLSLNQEVKVRVYDPYNSGLNVFLASITLQVSFLRRGLDPNETFDTTEMASVFLQNFNGQFFSTAQPLCFDFHGVNLAVTVTETSVVNMDELKAMSGAPGASSVPSASNGAGGNGASAAGGVLVPQTAINFTKASDSTIRLKGTAKSSANRQLLSPNFNFEDMGIGGLDKEFSAIFRRAFASRIFPPALVEKLGIQHVRGLMLYGPPGTGKTLMARQIGKMLNAKEIQVVNGPEILNKYVGASEENIRKLFAEAEKDYKQYGDESGLHIIIFDELDAICRQRGSRNDGTGVGDSVVNQLLSKMDGVDQLNNILIIGMTNRLDMIDEALLRPGRLEIHMEISLPDENGRFQILKIHTTRMKSNNILDPDVDLREIAQLTKNFSGAEIAGLIKSASSFAFNRHVRVNTAQISTDLENMKVIRDDFLSALDEVRPAFGVSEKELEPCVVNGIFRYATVIDRILSDGQLYYNQVRNSSRTPLVSVLLHGPPGCGKTALAATIGMNSDYPFIKLISPESMLGFSEQAKVSAINKVFSDAYKSPLSVILVDALERLVDWVPIGPRFSNSVLQTLLVLLKKAPPKGRKLLILATSSNRAVLEQMDMLEAFNAQIYVPNITSLDSVDFVVRGLKLFSDAEHARALDLLRTARLDTRLSLPVKKLIMIAEMARQDVDKIEKFVAAIEAEGVQAPLPSF